MYEVKKAILKLQEFRLISIIPHYTGSLSVSGMYNWAIGVSCLFMVACTEVYAPELELTDNVLYIEGGVTNAPGPHEIILRYTAGYNEKADFRPAGGAQISLLEEGREVCRYHEMSEGIYTTDSLFSAFPGRSYQLHIEAPDGHVYESESQVLPVSNLPVDSVYGIKEIRKIKYYNVYGEFILLEQEVNQIYADIPSADENTYYRFDCQLVLEHASGIITNPGSGEADIIPLYVWDSFYPDDLSVIEVNTQREKLSKFPLTHAIEDNESYAQYKYKYFPAIEAEYDERIADIVQVEVETDTGIILVDSIIYGIPVEMNDADYFYGWITKIEQYSLTREAYTFWSDVQKLEESEGEIFDPIATQLRGNMVCTSDESKLMLGLFEVASKIITPAFVNYHPNGENYLGMRIEISDHFPDNGWKDTIPPDFWVDKVFPDPNKEQISVEDQMLLY